MGRIWTGIGPIQPGPILDQSWERIRWSLKLLLRHMCTIQLIWRLQQFNWEKLECNVTNQCLHQIKNWTCNVSPTVLLTVLPKKEGRGSPVWSKQGILFQKRNVSNWTCNVPLSALDFSCYSKNKQYLHDLNRRLAVLHPSVRTLWRETERGLHVFRLEWTWTPNVDLGQIQFSIRFIKGPIPRFFGSGQLGGLLGNWRSIDILRSSPNSGSLTA